MKTQSARRGCRLPVYTRLPERVHCCGDTTALYGLVCGPFTLASHLRGNALFTDMFDFEEEACDLISFCAGPCKEIFDHIRAQGAFSSFFVCGDATRNIEVMCQTGPDGIPERDLEHFLNLFAETTFRIKGFVRTDKGICLVSCVGNLVSIEPYDSEVSEDQTGTLIVLSGAGMGVKKAVREAHNTYFDKS